MPHEQPDLDIINVTGLKCVGVPIGTPDFVNGFVRSKALDIGQDLHKLRILQDPKFITICSDFINTRALLLSPATCLLM